MNEIEMENISKITKNALNRDLFFHEQNKFADSINSRKSQFLKDSKFKVLPLSLDNINIQLLDPERSNQALRRECTIQAARPLKNPPSFLRLTTFIQELNSHSLIPPKGQSLASLSANSSNINTEKKNIKTSNISEVNIYQENDHSSQNNEDSDKIDIIFQELNKEKEEDKEKTNNLRLCCFKKKKPIIKIRNTTKVLSLESKNKWLCMMRKILMIHRVITALLEVKREVDKSQESLVIESPMSMVSNAVDFIKSLPRNQSFQIKATKPKRKCIILPNNKIGWGWSILIIILLLWSGIYLPYRLAFLDKISLGYWLMELVIDILFALDIIINFFSAYYDEQHNIVKSHQKIAKKYLSTWFIVDFISVFPFHFLTSSENQQYSKGFRLLRLPRLYKLLKVLRLFKVLRQTEFYNKIIFMIKLNEGVVRLINMIFIMLFIAHFSACLWYLLAKVDGFSPGCWVMRQGVLDYSNINKYIVALYWVTQTLTTVGYGDIPVGTTEEQVFAMILMIGGVGFYSYTIGNLSSIFANIDSRQSKLKSNILALNEFALSMKLDPRLYFKILEVYKRNAATTYYSIFDQHNLLKELPSALKNEVLNCTHKKILESFMFFKNKPISFVMNLLPKFTRITLSANDVLYRKTDLVEEIYFVLSGRIGLTTPEGFIFRNYVNGSYFGEIELFQDTNFREHTALAMEETQILVLKKHDLENAIYPFPEAAQEMAIVAYQRYEKNIFAISIAEKAGYKLDNKKLSLLGANNDFRFHEFFAEKEQESTDQKSLTGKSDSPLFNAEVIVEQKSVMSSSSFSQFHDNSMGEDYINIKLPHIKPEEDSVQKSHFTEEETLPQLELSIPQINTPISVNKEVHEENTPSCNPLTWTPGRKSHVPGPNLLFPPPPRDALAGLSPRFMESRRMSMYNQPIFDTDQLSDGNFSDALSDGSGSSNGSLQDDKLEISKRAKISRKNRRRKKPPLKSKKRRMSIQAEGNKGFPILGIPTINSNQFEKGNIGPTNCFRKGRRESIDMNSQYMKIINDKLAQLGIKIDILTLTCTSSDNKMELLGVKIGEISEQVK